MTAAILADGLRRTFGGVVAVDDVDLDIPAGAIFGLLGPDGAGKSTLIKLLATVLRPDRGDARVFGASVTGSAAAVRPRIGYMSQSFCMYPDLSVAENLEFFATLRGVPRAVRATRARSLLESMGLYEFRRRRAEHLSGGMKQKLMLAATLMHEPDLLLLDEPTTGVDPVSRREFWTILGDLHAAGKTALVATPYMDEASRCTHIAFLDGGRIRHRGTPAEIAGLVPGRLVEIGAPEPRAVLAAVTTGPLAAQVRYAHLYGDVVRVLVDGPPEALRTLTEQLRASGVPLTSVDPVSVDMETAFVYLAEAAPS